MRKQKGGREKMTMNPVGFLEFYDLVSPHLVSRGYWLDSNERVLHAMKR